MKCRLKSNSYCDKNFQIEFDSVSELEDLVSSLSHMLKYIKICKEDGEEIPSLIYQINEITNNP